MTWHAHGLSMSFLTQPLEYDDFRGTPRHLPWRWRFPELPQMITLTQAAGQAALGGPPAPGFSPSSDSPAAGPPSPAGRTSDIGMGCGPAGGTSDPRPTSGPPWLSPNALLKVLRAVVTSLGITHTELPWLWATCGSACTYC